MIILENISEVRAFLDLPPFINILNDMVTYFTDTTATTITANIVVVTTTIEAKLDLVANRVINLYDVVRHYKDPIFISNNLVQFQGLYDNLHDIHRSIENIYEQHQRIIIELQQIPIMEDQPEYLSDMYDKLGNRLRANGNSVVRLMRILERGIMIGDPQFVPLPSQWFED